MERKIPSVQLKRCKGCGICAEFCPQKVFTQDELGRAQVSYPEKCIGCKLCEYRCPDYAIRMVKQE